MKLEKGTVRTLAFVLFGAILFYWALDHWELLWNAVRLCARLTFPFFLGFCIAFVLNVPMRALEKNFWPETDKKALNVLRRPMCILVSLVLILAILTAVVMLVVPELVNAFGVLADQIPVFLKNAQAWLLANGDAFPALQDWLSAAQIDWNSIGQTLLGYVTTGAGNLLGGTVHVVTGIAGGATNTIIAFIFALYILLGKEKFKHQLIVLGQAFLPQRACNALAHVGKVAARTFAKFVSGQCIEACILGTLCWLGMLLFRFPYAPMVGALVGISALVPIVGALVGTVVGAFMIMMVDPILAVWFVVFLLVLQQIEGNLIYPRVVGSSVGLPPVWVLVAVTVGGSLYGVAGMLFGVPTASVAYTLVKEAAARRLAAKAAGNAPAGGTLPQNVRGSRRRAAPGRRRAGEPCARPERNFHEFIVRCEKHAEKRPRGPQPCGSDAFVPGVPCAYFLPHLSLAVWPPALFSGAHRQPVGPGLYRH